MSSPGLLGILSWAAFPLVGALVGFCAARITARIATRPALRRVSRITARLLDRSPASFLSTPPSARALQSIARDLLQGLVSSPGFLRAVREAVSTGVASISAWTVRDFVRRTGLSRFLEENLLGRLADVENRREIARSIGTVVGELPFPVGDGLPQHDASAILAPLVPAAANRLVEGLKSPQIRELLAMRGRELLPKILEKLNVLQRFLLSAGQFDRRIDEKMPEIVDETIVAIEQVVRDPVQQGLFLEKLLQGVHDWRSSPSSRSEVGPAVAGLVEHALSRLADPRIRQVTPKLLETFLGGGEQAVGSALRLRFGVRDSELADSVANAALSWFSRPATQDAIAGRLADAGSRFIAAGAGAPLRTLLRVTPERKASFDSFVGRRLHETSGSWSPPLVRRAGLIGAAAGCAVGVGIGIVELLLGLFRQ